VGRAVDDDVEEVDGEMVLEPPRGSHRSWPGSSSRRRRRTQVTYDRSGAQVSFPPPDGDAA
jgi:hypothetical protein